MANPVVLLLLTAGLVVLTVGYCLAVTLPRLVVTQLRLVWRTFGRAPATAPPGPHDEPAVPVYVRVTAPRDLRAAWWDGLVAHARLMGDAERFVIGRAAGPRRPDPGTGGRGCLMILLRPAFLLAAAAVVLTVAALSLLPLLFALLVWAVCGALWTLWWTVWATVARARRVPRRRPSPCPYTRCGRAVDRPVRLCPSCHSRHRLLAPNRYGALYHRCRCGTRLPAVLGVSRLQACCPHCGNPLPAGYERARAVVLVGGSDMQRAGVHRQGLAELGAAPGGEPPLVRRSGRPVLFHDPVGDAYGSQESTARLDLLRLADGLLLVVDDPAAHSAAVHAVTRVLHVVTALPERHRPRRLALLYTRAARGDDGAVRAGLEAAGGGHLLRALDSTGIPVRCVAASADASALAGTLLWLAGTGGTPGAGESVAPPPAHRPGNVSPHMPRHRLARRGLLLSHLAGYLVLPLALVLLEAGVLPPGALFGVPGAYDRWRHPLTGTVHQVDLAAAATPDWPRLSASYSAPGHPPAAVLPGHPGYWSVKGAPADGNWLRFDFGMPLPLSEVSVDFDPATIDGPFSLSVDLEGQIGARTLWDGISGRRAHLEGKGFGKVYGYDYSYPHTVDSLRFGLGSLLDKGQEKKLRLREVDIRWTSSDALRLHPADDGRLGIENATARDLAIAVRPPLLPAGWQAALAERPPRMLGAHTTYVAHWRITAPKAAAGRAPVAYAVDVTERGHTVTSRCLGLLTAAGNAESLC